LNNQFLLSLYLFENGYISSLDDPIKKYVPSFSYRDPHPTKRSGITFRQLSSQLSGLPRTSPCVSPCNLSVEVMFSRISQISLLHPTSTKPSYSNLGFSILGRVCEIITKTKFEDLIQKIFVNGLGLTGTGNIFTQQIINRMATGYSTPLLQLGFDNPAGQMFSTTNDFDKLISFLFRTDVNASKSQPLDGATLREMLTPNLAYYNNDGKTGFGSPWETYHFENEVLVIKEGDLPGYHSMMVVLPELKIGLSILQNCEGDGNPGNIVQQFTTYLLPTMKNILIKNQKLSFPQIVTPYVGIYFVEGTNNSYINITYTSNMLIAMAIVQGNTQNQFFLLKDTEVNSLIIKTTEFPQPYNGCMIKEFMATDGDRLLFYGNKSKYDYFEIPGLLYGTKWLRR